MLEGGDFSKIDSKGDFFLKFEEFFIAKNIPQKAILYTPESDLNGKECASIMCACIAHVRDQGERCAD